MPAMPTTSVPAYNLDRSHEAFVRAQPVIPGGVNSPARAFGAVGGEPPFMARAEGPYLYDIDGHQYIDYIGSWGPMILGHAQPEVKRAVAEALELGTSFGAPTVREVEIAEAVVGGRPVDREGPVRLVGDRGGDVGRPGGPGRHGPATRSSRWPGIITATSTPCSSRPARRRRRSARPTAPASPPGAAADTILCPFNDVEAVAEVFAALSRPDRRGPAGAGRRQHGARPAEPGLPGTPPRADREARRDPHLRRGDDRLPPRPRRGPGAVRHHARPDGAGQDHRRRPARGGLRGVGRDHGLRLARRADLPGRHALGQPAGRWPPAWRR